MTGAAGGVDTRALLDTTIRLVGATGNRRPQLKRRDVRQTSLESCAQATAEGPLDMHEFAQDVTVRLEEDRAGSLAGVLEVIAGAEINLEGYALIEGLLHFLTKDASAAREALEKAGVRVRRQRAVLGVHADNEIGSAARIFRRIADAELNIHFTYVLADNRIVVGADSLATLVDLQLSGAA